MTENVTPLILAFVADLYFATRIESAAERLGGQVRFVERPQQRQDAADSSNYNLAGLGELLRARRPTLLIFDLNNGEIPWGDWIPAVCADPEWRTIPVVAFGSHVETDTLARARAAGAQAVMARSRFVSTLPEILAKYLAA